MIFIDALASIASKTTLIIIVLCIAISSLELVVPVLTLVECEGDPCLWAYSDHPLILILHTMHLSHAQTLL